MLVCRACHGHCCLTLLSASVQVFVEAVKKVEKYDHARVESRLGSVGAAPLLQRVGE